MKEAKKDLFASLHEDGVDAICITTNGLWTLDGKAVMGGGCARVCADNWPETSRNLGGLLKNNAGVNIPYLIGVIEVENGQSRYGELEKAYLGDQNTKLIFSFPTIDNLIDGADLELIRRSAAIMMQYADAYQLRSILIGRPGAGIGGLSYYEQVKPAIQKILDDRFTIVSFEHEE